MDRDRERASDLQVLLFFSLFFFSLGRYRLIAADDGRNRPLLTNFEWYRRGNSPNRWYRPVASGPHTSLLANRYVPPNMGGTHRYCKPCF
ncbi:hypothetical protein BHM03_00016304 [Ensete ventricosum]|nr:hypothetical protein BHM03_00016304 [Ensete ventricosum]